MLVTHHILNKIYPKRKPDAVKGDFGRLLVVVGTYTGAPALVAEAALRTGVDTVHIAAPKEQARIIASFSPDFIVKPLPTRIINTEAIKHIRKMIQTASAVCIGSRI